MIGVAMATHLAADLEARVAAAGTIAADPSFVVHNVSWNEYRRLRALLDEGHAGLKITYLEGTLELTSPSKKHELTKTAIGRLEALLGGGQAPQQILALLLWQFRVLLFASAMRTNADAERAAKAIGSRTSYAIVKWQPFARGVARADIVRAYEVLYATDLAIKTGRTEPENAMLLCILDLCGIHAADPRELVVGEPPRR